MTFQPEVYGILTKSARVLETIQGEGIQAEDAGFAAAKFLRAAKGIAMEPLSLEDIKAARATVREARPSLESLMGALKDQPTYQWLLAAVEGFNGTLDLLDGMEAAHKAVPTKPAQAAGLSKSFRSLIPSSWWGAK